MKLRLGVVDVPYADTGHATTTGDVAGFLENEYHVMQTFVDMHESGIESAIEGALSGALDDLLRGKPLSANILASAEQDIQSEFRKFLTNEEMAGKKGIPTKAALEGRSKRFKRLRGPRRPSFIDTGMYEKSFTAVFVDE